MDTSAAASGQPLTVVVLAGGRSSEHDVSLSSGAAVRDALLACGHAVVSVVLARDGSFRCEGERISVTPGAGLLGADVVFPALHGPFGEDGTVQGLLEMLDVAYVGAGVAASAVSMDKVLFKQLMAAVGVPMVDYVGVREERYRGSQEAVLGDIARLGLPVFVKPAHLGSSVGIVKVLDAGGLPAALDGAFTHDELVIVEAMAHGVEVECGVLGTLAHERDGGPEAQASEPGEIAFPGEWYDFRAKYTAGGMRLQVPAGISPAARARVQELALRTFVQAGCDGLARVDFFVDGEEVVVNELNTIPGFTPTSVYARLMQASGIDFATLADRLCRLALERQARRRAYRY